MSIKTDYPYIGELRNYRGKTYELQNKKGFKEFLEKIGFSVENGKLSKKDTKYLTGDWFEEYVYHRVKHEIPEADADTGIQLSKAKVPNQFDVMFTLYNTLYTIECKTFIVSADNIVAGTLYKSAALAKKLGLFGKNYVFTLDYRTKLDKEHIRRANEMGITLICREDLETGKTMSELMNIKKNAHQSI